MQQSWANKQHALSPTPAIECVKCILAIMTFEERDVASFDSPAQFLQTDVDKLSHPKTAGTVALPSAKSNPNKWEKCLHGERGEPATCVMCEKATHGTMSAAALAC